MYPFKILEEISLNLKNKSRIKNNNTSSISVYIKVCIHLTFNGKNTETTINAFTKSGPMNNCPIVAIGASAGGLEAYKELMENTPTNTGAAYVLIPHLSPNHKSVLDEILSHHTKMPVIQVDTTSEIKPNHVFIVPPNRNLKISSDGLHPTTIKSSDKTNKPIDFFLRSLAKAHREKSICIILSGALTDGSAGVRAIKEEGGLVIVQTPDSAKHSSMPESAINTGLVDMVLPTQEMPKAITNYINHSFFQTTPHSTLRNEETISEILEIIRTHSGYDFTCYKPNTLIRRIGRRMVLSQAHDITKYLEQLKTDPKEVAILFNDILIGVTEYFREPTIWEHVKTQVFTPLIADINKDTPFRVWVPACSSGEEPYTIAILLSEVFESLKRPFNAQIFATDIDELAINKARTGAYPTSISANLSEERLKRYFRQEDGMYHVRESLREKVIFAVQNIVSDAPFSNLHFISCRNLLIYLNGDIQNKIIELFHYALNEDGHLLLGNSESVGYNTRLFDTVNKESRIYKIIANIDRSKSVNFPLIKHISKTMNDTPTNLSHRKTTKSPRDLLRDHLTSTYAPPAVLLNTHGDIIQFFGDTSAYLNLPQDEPCLNLVTLAKEGLKLKLRGLALRLAKIQKEESVQTRLKRDSKYYSIRATLFPLPHKKNEEKLFILTFEEAPQTSDSSPNNAQEFDVNETESQIIHQLEDELKTTREDLKNSVEELEISNEELKASNEEMMSMNEELQSSNEELETSKEELHTVNAELRDKVQELESTNNDLINLMNSTNIATVFLDTNLRIRRFTPAAKKLFKLIPTDVGRPIMDLCSRFNDDRLNEDINRVLNRELLDPHEIKNDEGVWYSRNITPFQTSDNRIEGAVLTFTDISQQKENALSLTHNQKELRELNSTFSAMQENIEMMIAYLDTDFNFIRVNKAYAETNNKPIDWFTGKNHFKEFPNEENEKIFMQVLQTGKMHSVSMKPFNHPTKGYSYWNWSLSPVKNPAGDITGLVLSLIEVTRMVKLEEHNRLLESISDGFFSLDTNLVVIYFNSAAEKILNRNADAVLYHPLFESFPELKDSIFEENYTKALQDKELTAFQTYFEPHQKWYDVRVYPRENGISVFFRDISGAKDIQQKLKKSLDEKNTLLMELAHRTKNNMNIITSLLGMYSRSGKDIQTIAEELGRKIKVMALVHQKLHESKELSKVSLGEFIHDAANLIITSSTIDGISRPQMIYDIPDEKISLQLAVPLGLVLNELMTNSLKYAFPDKTEGKISISIDLSQQETLKMVFADNGVGMENAEQLDFKGSMGWLMIHTIIVHQLNGKLQRKNRDGLKVSIEFPLTKHY
jgi:PAS domain S-box-containing protein